MEFIIDPSTNEKHSIFSRYGKDLLKRYIKLVQYGGAWDSVTQEGGSGEQQTLEEFITFENEKVDNLNDCNKKLEQCEKDK